MTLTCILVWLSCCCCIGKLEHAMWFVHKCFFPGILTLKDKMWRWLLLKVYRCLSLWRAVRFNGGFMNKLSVPWLVEVAWISVPILQQNWRQLACSPAVLCTITLINTINHRNMSASRTQMNALSETMSTSSFWVINGW